MAARPVVLPEPFDGESSWEDWRLHFEDVAAVNEWTDAQKLKWLRVRLTGRAQKAFHRLPPESVATYRGATNALQERFEPKSRRTRYQAEFETRRKKKSEGWADFAEDLRSLADKAYPELQPEARELLSLQTYLAQLDQPQVAFSVKQRRPKSLDEAVASTLEMESYAPPTAKPVAVVQPEDDDVASKENEKALVASVDPSKKLVSLLERLMDRMDVLEKNQQASTADAAKTRRRTPSTAVPRRARNRRDFTGLCWTCQQPGHISRNCPQNPRTKSGN